NISSIKNEIDVGLVNRVVNGNMEQGRFGWSEYTGTTVEPKDDHILLKGDGKHNQLRIRQHDDYGVSKLAYKSGNKIYVSCEIKVKDSDAEYAGFRVWSTEGDSGFNDVEIRNPKKEKLNTISGTFTLGEGGSGNFYLQIRVGYPNSSMQNNKEVEVGKILFIDLTDAFGEGNEPNKKQMDYLLKLHEGHWFEKANVGSVAMSGIGGSHKGSDNSTNHDLPIVNCVKNSEFKDENNWNRLSGTT